MADGLITIDELDGYRDVMARLPVALQEEAAIDVRPRGEFGGAPSGIVGYERFVYRATGEEVKAGELLGHLRETMVGYLNREAAEWRLARVIAGSGGGAAVGRLDGSVSVEVEERVTRRWMAEGNDEMVMLAMLCEMCDQMVRERKWKTA